MKPADEVEEDGKKALAYNCATAMLIVHGFGEKDIRPVGIILAAKGYCTLNMRDLAPMGIPDPDGEKKTRVTGDPTTGCRKRSRNTRPQSGYTCTHHQGSTQESHHHHGSPSGLESD
jgi:hypothetical protein